jgi:hypothetical protein
LSGGKFKPPRLHLKSEGHSSEIGPRKIPIHHLKQNQGTLRFDF